MKPAMTSLSPQPRIEEAILDDCEGVFTQSDKAGHPRLAVLKRAKSWMAGPSPARTRWGRQPVILNRVMSFSRDKSTDRLWRQGIDLIGDKRGCDVGESIEDGAMLGKSEGREFLDVTDNGFDDVAPIEQSLVEERHR